MTEGEGIGAITPDGLMSRADEYTAGEKAANAVGAEIVRGVLAMNPPSAKVWRRGGCGLCG